MYCILNSNVKNFCSVVSRQNPPTVISNLTIRAVIEKKTQAHHIKKHNALSPKI